ncbi:hypothetical protein ACFX1X_022204 [Malus domestica]
MNPQHQVLLSRNCNNTVSLLPHNSSASINPTTASSNLSFGSSSALNFNQQRPLSLPHKFKQTTFTAKRVALQTIVAYSEGDKESASESLAKELRQILELPGVVQAPACFNVMRKREREFQGFFIPFASDKERVREL